MNILSFGWGSLGNGGGGGVSGSGTLNIHAKWTPDGSTLGNSVATDDGTNMGIGAFGTAFTPQGKLHVRTSDIGAGISPDAAADDLVVENDSDAGLSIFHEASNNGNIYYGVTGNPDAMRLSYLGLSDTWQATLDSAAWGALSIDGNGTTVGISVHDALFNVIVDDTLGVPASSATTCSVFADVGATTNDNEVSILSGSNASAFLNFGDDVSEKQGRIEYDNSNNSMRLFTNASVSSSVFLGNDSFVGFDTETAAGSELFRVANGASFDDAVDIGGTGIAASLDYALRVRKVSFNPGLSTYNAATITLQNISTSTTTNGINVNNIANTTQTTIRGALIQGQSGEASGATVEGANILGRARGDNDATETATGVYSEAYFQDASRDFAGSLLGADIRALVRASNSSTGTCTALQLTATGGDSNYGLVIDDGDGDSGFGTLTPVSGVDIQTSMGWQRRGVAADANTADDIIVGVTNTAAARTITLDTDDTVDGRVIIIKDESGGAGTNNITIDTEGAETIDGSASVTITANYGVVRVYSDGTNWFTF